MRSFAHTWGVTFACMPYAFPRPRQFPQEPTSAKHTYRGHRGAPRCPQQCKLARASTQCRFRRAEGCTLQDDPVALRQQAHRFRVSGHWASEWTLLASFVELLKWPTCQQLAKNIAANSQKLQCHLTVFACQQLSTICVVPLCKYGHRTMLYKPRPVAQSSALYVPSHFDTGCFPACCLISMEWVYASVDCWRQAECRTLLDFVSMFIRPRAGQGGFYRRQATKH